MGLGDGGLGHPQLVAETAELVGGGRERDGLGIRDEFLLFGNGERGSTMSGELRLQMTTPTNVIQCRGRLSDMLELIGT